MIFDLPSDVLSEIFADWLTGIDILRLDASVANKSDRQKFESELQKSVITLRGSPEWDDDKIYRVYRWVQCRGVKVTELGIGDSCCSLGPLSSAQLDILRGLSVDCYGDIPKKTMKFLTSMLRQCSSLTSLTFRIAGSISDELLECVRCLPNPSLIRSMSLQRGFVTKSLAGVSKVCKNIEELSLGEQLALNVDEGDAGDEGSDDADDDDEGDEEEEDSDSDDKGEDEAEGPRCTFKRLKTLNIDTNSFERSELSFIIDKCTCLETVEVYIDRECDSDVLQPLQAHGATIKSLTLVSSDEGSFDMEDDVFPLLDACTALESVDLAWGEEIDHCYVLTHLPDSLKELNLSGPVLHDCLSHEALADLSARAELEVIVLDGWLYDIPGELLDGLAANCPKLRTFSLPSSKGTYEADALSELRKACPLLKN